MKTYFLSFVLFFMTTNSFARRDHENKNVLDQKERIYVKAQTPKTDKLWRLTKNGAVDTTFGNSGFITAKPNNALCPRPLGCNINSFDLISDGILIGGYASHHFYVTKFDYQGKRVLRYGDRLFQMFKNASSIERCVPLWSAIRAIDKYNTIVACKASIQNRWGSRVIPGKLIALSRFGSRKTSFGKVSELTDFENLILLNDKTFIARSSTYNKTTKMFDPGLARLSPKGKAISSFTVKKVLRDAKPQFQAADGKIILLWENFDSSGLLQKYLIKMNLDGSLDKNFGLKLNGSEVIKPGFSKFRLTHAVEQTDGKILVFGNSSKQELFVMRFNKTGTIDKSYGTSGIVLPRIKPTTEYNWAGNIWPTPKNSALLFGSNRDLKGNNATFVLKLDSKGQLDKNFNTTGIVLLK